MSTSADAATVSSHQRSPQPPKDEKSHVKHQNATKNKHHRADEVTDTASSRSRAKQSHDRLASSGGEKGRSGGPYIPIKYEEDRVRQEAVDMATVLELKQQQQTSADAKFNTKVAGTLGGISTTATTSPQQQTMLLAGRRATIGNATINPKALKIHPRGFKLLASSSPLERNMKSYFRLPPQPPARVTLEHQQMQDQIKQTILAAEQKRLRNLSADDAHKSIFGGTSTANSVSTTITTTIARPSGIVETVNETIYGKQLDGFLLLENSVGLPGVTGYDEEGNPIFDSNSRSNDRGGGGGSRGAAKFMTVAERYYRERTRLQKREERAQAAHERDLRRQAKLEAKLEKIRRRDAALEKVRNGAQVEEEEVDLHVTKTFLTGTKLQTEQEQQHDQNGDENENEDDDLFLGSEGDEVEESTSHSTSDNDEEGEEDELDLENLGTHTDDGDLKPPTDPSLAVEANINDRNLIGVVPEDLSFFSRLVFVDAGENRLLVSDFAKLPAIEELHLHCNVLTQLSDIGDVVTEAIRRADSGLPQQQERGGGGYRGKNNHHNNNHVDEDGKEGESSRSDTKMDAATRPPTGSGDPDDAAATTTKRENKSNPTPSSNNDHRTKNGKLNSSASSFVPFLCLHSLNLSFNRIPSHELVYLAHLPSLTRLDLSNNNLKTIPLDFALSAAPNVTHLALEGNKFKNALHIFSCLAVMPSLVEVNLNENNFEAIPSSTEMLSYLPAAQQQQQQQRSAQKNDGGAGDQERENGNEDDPHSYYPIFPALLALGIANNKLQFVEDVFPVVQFPQLQRIVLWGNPLASQSRDVVILTEELSSAGISEIILDNPTLPKRHPQDFYSVCPPKRNDGANNKKYALSSTFGKPMRGNKGKTDTAREDLVFRKGGESHQQLLTSETAANVQQIFEATTATSATIRVNGPGGAFIRLPAEIHSDYSHIKGLKGQGLSQHSLPTVLPSDRLKKKKLRMQKLAAAMEAEGGGGGNPTGVKEDEAMFGIPTTHSSRLRSGNQKKETRSEDGGRNGRLGPLKPTAGTFSSVSAPTTSAKSRSEVTKDEQNELKRRQAEEERWLPALDTSKYGRSQQRGGWGGEGGSGSEQRSPLLSGADNNNNTANIPYYLGGNGGGITDGSTTQQALNELRRMLKK